MPRLWSDAPQRLKGCVGCTGPGEMLMLMMVVATATMRLWPLVRAQSPCRTRMVRTGKTLNVIQQVQGDILYFSPGKSEIIEHPCRENVAVYLGKYLFFTRDNFESSLLPFAIPASMKVSTPHVTAAHFSGPRLLLVVNRKLYIYDFEKNSWDTSAGIHHPVTHISGDNCCFNRNAFCRGVSNDVFVYLRGDPLSQTSMYLSNNGGYSFDLYTYEGQALMAGTLGGIFYFHSLSQIGMLVINNDTAVFIYSEHPLNQSQGLAFEYSRPLDIIIIPGQRGFLLLWSEKNVLVSPNSGQLINTIELWQGGQILHHSISEAQINIHSIAINKNAMALLTLENNLYYGTMGYLSSSVIKLVDQTPWPPGTALIFKQPGMLELVTPVADSAFLAFDFQKCLINVQSLLMTPSLQMSKCKVELLEGEIEDTMFTIDMNSQLHLTASIIPRAGTSPIPLVMVSNPHALALHATISESGNTLDGNSIFKLDVQLMQQQLWGRTNPNFTTSIKRPTTSTLTVDIANKEISCVDLRPLSSLISVGCDLTKRIAVQNKISACSKNILDAVELQKNYTYVIEKEAYNPNFHKDKATNDLLVVYPYKDLGCPRLVYYSTPWKPVVELWQGDTFQEIVDAEFVLLEVNGVFTYSYSLTAGLAECSSQPQNWTTISEGFHRQGPAVWNRENYISCHEPGEDDNPLLWPDVEYQILGGPTDNRIEFDQRNGIYIFLLSIVDPYYSYCHLETTFSVYVHGAYPLPLFQPGAAIALLVIGILLTVALAHFTPKLLRSDRGLCFRTCCRQWGMLLSCLWIRRWLRARRARGARRTQAAPP